MPQGSARTRPKSVAAQVICWGADVAGRARPGRRAPHELGPSATIGAGEECGHNSSPEHPLLLATREDAAAGGLARARRAQAVLAIRRDGSGSGDHSRVQSSAMPSRAKRDAGAYLHGAKRLFEHSTCRSTRSTKKHKVSPMLHSLANKSPQIWGRWCSTAEPTARVTLKLVVGCASSPSFEGAQLHLCSSAWQACAGQTRRRHVLR